MSKSLFTVSLWYATDLFLTHILLFSNTVTFSTVKIVVPSFWNDIASSSLMTGFNVRNLQFISFKSIFQFTPATPRTSRSQISWDPPLGIFMSHGIQSNTANWLGNIQPNAIVKFSTTLRQPSFYVLSKCNRSHLCHLLYTQALFSAQFWV